MNLKLIITDFDGTLVNTFEANYQAYAEAFTQGDRKLTRDSYIQCFGYRYDDFMRAVGVDDADVRQRIRKIKGQSQKHLLKNERNLASRSSKMKNFVKNC